MNKVKTSLYKLSELTPAWESTPNKFSPSNLVKYKDWFESLEEYHQVALCKEFERGTTTRDNLTKRFMRILTVPTKHDLAVDMLRDLYIREVRNHE